MMAVTQQYLKYVLSYDQYSGEFRWQGKVSDKSRATIGGIAGCCNTNGYRQIGILGRKYLASRLAFLYMTGKWPSDLVDHIDRNQRNNAWANLREATRTENNRNIATRKIKTSPFRGVSKRGDKWLVVIRVGGKPKYIGQYTCELEAGRIAAPYFADIAP